MATIGIVAILFDHEWHPILTKDGTNKIDVTYSTYNNCDHNVLSEACKE